MYGSRVKERGPGRLLPQYRIYPSKYCGHGQPAYEGANPLTPSCSSGLRSLDFLPPAEERLQLAGAVDEAEYIHTVLQRPVENEHPFKPCDAEHA